ncbi:MAG TPA: fatty acid desaturase [Minicystis sp.]|nr:fatty acid desaturase [Minicystis sp.]
MDAVPREILQAAYKRNSVYLLKIPLLYGIWAGATVVLFATQSTPYAIPIGIACSILIAYVIRGLGAIAHDAVHGTCAKSKIAGYFLSLAGWLPTGMSVTVYANYHLHHHKIANTYPDVDNFVVTDYTRNPFLAKLLLLVVYGFGYPMYFLGCMLRHYVKRLTPLQRVRMNLEVALWASLVGIAYWKMPHQVFFFFYGLPFVLGAGLASLTSMIEHYEMLPGPDDAYSSRTYGTKNRITNFLWCNVTYHNEHHKYPGIPWYNLRRFHEAAYPYYDDEVKSAVHTDIYGIAFKLYGRILRLDLAKLDERYADTNKEAERKRLRSMPGISPEAA